MSDLYFCPTAREVESATGGGFDNCCSHPELHVPMPDDQATAAVAQALSDAAKREFALQQQVARIRAFLEDMAGWCSPHGVAADYSRRALDALDGADPFEAIRPKHEEVPEPDDGFRWHVLSQCPDETACPIHGRDTGEPTGPEDTSETDQQLHARFACPGWEYRTTEGPRKQWDDQDRPPSDEDGNPDPSWEVNVDAGRDGWERFDYTEEAYWRRRVVSGSR